MKNRLNAAEKEKTKKEELDSSSFFANFVRSLICFGAFGRLFRSTIREVQKPVRLLQLDFSQGSRQLMRRIDYEVVCDRVKAGDHQPAVP